MAVPIKASRAEIIDPLEEIQEAFGETPYWPQLTPYGVDIREDAEHIFVEAEMPGFTKEEVEVGLANQTLTITAQHKKEMKEQKKGYLLRERSEQAYRRVFTLPPGINEKAVDAKLTDGVLTVTLNKTEQAKAHKVSVH